MTECECYIAVDKNKSTYMYDTQPSWNGEEYLIIRGECIQIPYGFVRKILGKDIDHNDGVLQIKHDGTGNMIPLAQIERTID